MADDAAAAEAGKEEKKSRGALPVILGAVGALVLGLAGGGAGVYFWLGSSAPADAAPAEGAAAAADPAVAGAPAAGAAGAAGAMKPKSEVADLDTFTLNLRDSAGGRKLVMKIALEGPPGVTTQIDDHRQQIRDAVITLASDYTFLEVDGTNGKLRLRDEVHRNINAILQDSGVAITRVYFTEFVVE
jgi:flagellar basal body-associated protein FliL